MSKMILPNDIKELIKDTLVGTKKYWKKEMNISVNIIKTLGKVKRNFKYMGEEIQNNISFKKLYFLTNQFVITKIIDNLQHKHSLKVLEKIKMIYL